MFALTDEKALLTFEPIDLMTRMLSAAINATMIPYSTIVAPDSSAISDFNIDFSYIFESTEE